MSQSIATSAALAETAELRRQAREAKRLRVLAFAAANPELTHGEIARACGVGYDAATNWIHGRTTRRKQ